jgi:hypothetical protein
VGLKHEFYLIPDTTELTDFNIIKNNIIDRVVINDDVILYILDSLYWIPSKKPSSRKHSIGKGLNYYGITLFDKQSSEALVGVFSAWKSLFKNAPEVIELTGNFVISNGEEGEYEKIMVIREELITQLDMIISMSRLLADGNYYLYHCGI